MSKKNYIIPAPPRYDDIFFNGTRLLDWQERHGNLTICLYFKNLDNGIECAARNCPCGMLYTPEENK